MSLLLCQEIDDKTLEAAATTPRHFLALAWSRAFLAVTSATPLSPFMMSILSLTTLSSALSSNDSFQEMSSIRSRTLQLTSHCRQFDYYVLTFESRSTWSHRRSCLMPWSMTLASPSLCGSCSRSPWWGSSPAPQDWPPQSLHILLRLSFQYWGPWIQAKIRPCPSAGQSSQHTPWTPSGD